MCRNFRLRAKINGKPSPPPNSIAFFSERKAFIFVNYGRNQRLPMLRFFRTLRRRLLAENRLSQYLLYAIGEIILVVIGRGRLSGPILQWTTNRCCRGRQGAGHLSRTRGAGIQDISISQWPLIIHQLLLIFVQLSPEYIHEKGNTGTGRTAKDQQ